MRQIKIALFLLIIAGNYIICNSQIINSQGVDKLVKKTIKAFDVPGIAVGIVKDGKLIHSKGDRKSVV